MKTITLILLLFIVPPLYGAETPPDFFTMSLAELMKMEITGSTLTSETLKSVPAAVTVFSHSEIRRMGLDTLDELMAMAPGFQAYSSSVASQQKYISSRGRRINNTGAEILIMVDGQRYDEPRSSGSMVVTPKIPLHNIERVEFIRGPGATIYGSNALQGVVNIITRSGVNEVEVSYGSFDRRQVSFLAGQDFSGLTVDLSGHLEEDRGDNFLVQDGLGNNGVETSDPRILADFSLKLHYKDTRINFQHSQLEVEDFYELGTVSNGVNQRSTRFSSLSLQQDFSWLTVNSWVWIGYHSTDFRTQTQLTGPGVLLAASSGASTDPLYLGADFDNSSEIRTQWHNDWKVNAKSNFQFGLELRRIDIPETIAKNNFDMRDLANGDYPIRYYGDFRATTPVEAESSRNILGVYGQYQRHLFTGSEITLGLRYDEFSEVGGQLSPRFGWVQELSEHQNVKILYGEAFRAPTENEQYLLNNPVALGNPKLEAETVDSWEIIWLGQWAQTSLNIGYFENHFKDTIAQTLVSGVIQYSNVDQGPVKGFELEGMQEIGESWQLRATYTLFSEKPESSYREASQLVSLMLNYNRGSWNANLIATYAGEREMPVVADESRRIILDGYWLAFAKVYYTFNAHWQGFVEAKNLLDTSYETPGGNGRLDEGVPNRGREVLLGLSWKW